MPNKVVGMIHGLLFILYVFITTLYASEEEWPFKKKLIAYGAAVIPFGPFVFEKKYLK